MNIPTLHTQKITLCYGEHTIIRDLTLDISQPEIVTIIGPNGSGKSTLLKALCRLLEPASGAVYLDSKDINKMSTEEVARTLAVMAQSANAPGGTTVEELVCYGRMPYRKFFDGLNQEDRLAIEEALEFTELVPLRTRLVHTLSGGERQRAWLAMALALGIVLGSVVALVRVAHDQQRPGHKNPVLSFCCSMSLRPILMCIISWS